MKSVATPISSRQRQAACSPRAILHLNASHVTPTAMTRRAPRVRLPVLPEGLHAEVQAPGRPRQTATIPTSPNQANQEIHAFHTLTEHTKIIALEPHLHAQGVRMCPRPSMNIQQLIGRPQLDSIYEDDAAPIPLKGTILHPPASRHDGRQILNMADGRRPGLPLGLEHVQMSAIGRCPRNSSRWPIAAR